MRDECACSFWHHTGCGLASLSAFARLPPPWSTNHLDNHWSALASSSSAAVAFGNIPVSGACCLISTLVCDWLSFRVCMNVLVLTWHSCLLLSCSAVPLLRWFFASRWPSPSQSYNQWDSVDLPLCEAYRRRDSWASVGSSRSSSQGEQEESEGPLQQDVNSQHHLNGHAGGASIEKPWTWGYFESPNCLPAEGTFLL